jgi:hypothetical protein
MAPGKDVPTLGNRTWLVSVKELAENRFPRETGQVEDGEKKALSLVADEDLSVSHLRWVGKSKFRSEVLPGDRVKQISTSLSGKRKTVIAPCTIIWRQDSDYWTRLYYQEQESCPRLAWTSFKKKAKAQGLTLNLKTRELNSRELLAHEILWG